jgi:hypothetical protein
MRRPLIALGAALAALGTASPALSCSLIPAGPGVVRDVSLTDSGGRTLVTWDRQGEPREGVAPRAVALGAGGWTWTDPADLPAPAPDPARGLVSPLGPSAAVGLGAGGHAVALARVDEAVPGAPGSRRRTIRAADRSPDGTWSPAYTLAGPDAPSPPPFSTCGYDGYGAPAVAVDGAGNAVAAWIAREPEPAGKVLQWAARPAGGPWSAPVTLGPAGDALDLRMDASGTALLAWDGAGGLRAAVRPPGGAFGPSELLGPLSHGWLGFGALRPSLRVDASGRALAVWGSSERRIVAATRAPGGEWTAPVDLSAVAENAPPLISGVRVSRKRLRAGATALTFRMRAAGEVIVTVRRRGRGPAVRGVRLRAARGLNRIVLLRRPVRPGAYTVQIRARATSWAPARRSARVVVLP